MLDEDRLDEIFFLGKIIGIIYREINFDLVIEGRSLFLKNWRINKLD